MGKRVVSLIDIVVELHDHGGWNFTEIAEYLDRQRRAEYYSSEYHKYKQKTQKRKFPYAVIVLDVLKIQGGEGLTQKQLAEASGLHRAKVCVAVSKLLEWNLVKETKIRTKCMKRYRWRQKVLVSAVTI
jgi:hypothetical protein